MDMDICVSLIDPGSISVSWDLLDDANTNLWNSLNMQETVIEFGNPKGIGKPTTQNQENNILRVSPKVGDHFFGFWRQILQIPLEL